MLCGLFLRRYRITPPLPFAPFFFPLSLSLSSTPTRSTSPSPFISHVVVLLGSHVACLWRVGVSTGVSPFGGGSSVGAATSPVLPVNTSALGSFTVAQENVSFTYRDTAPGMFVRSMMILMPRPYQYVTVTAVGHSSSNSNSSNSSSSSVYSTQITRSLDLS